MTSFHGISNYAKLPKEKIISCKIRKGTWSTCVITFVIGFYVYLAVFQEQSKFFNCSICHQQLLLFHLITIYRNISHCGPTITKYFLQCINRVRYTKATHSFITLVFDWIFGRNAWELLAGIVKQLYHKNTYITTYGSVLHFWKGNFGSASDFFLCFLFYSFVFFWLMIIRIFLKQWCFSISRLVLNVPHAFPHETLSWISKSNDQFQAHGQQQKSQCNNASTFQLENWRNRVAISINRIPERLCICRQY